MRKYELRLQYGTAMPETPEGMDEGTSNLAINWVLYNIFGKDATLEWQNPETCWITSNRNIPDGTFPNITRRAQKLEGPIQYKNLPPLVREEMVAFLTEGNTKEELAELVLEGYVHETMFDLIKDMHKLHQDAELYPHTAELEV